LLPTAEFVTDELMNYRPESPFENYS